MDVPVTTAEIAALLALSQDHAFAQPAGSQLRATVLGQQLAVAIGADESERGTTWFTSALRFLGCTGHAFDMAVVFGDEIEMRAESLQLDFANPFDMMRLMVTHAGAGTTGVRRMRTVLAVLAGGKKAAEMNFRAACEVADVFAKRLGLDGSVRDALSGSFERWNGRGLPSGARGPAIARPMRVAQIAQELEVLARIEGIERARQIIRARRGKAYDPELADVVLREAAGWWDEVEPLDPWDAALSLAPPGRALTDQARLESLLVLADFSDLKSPWLGGHSRAVAALALDACGPEAEAAALVHDIGRVAVPNVVWDKPGGLTRDERDRAELHAFATDQLLRRVPYTRALADVACSAHERVGGSGYHRRERHAPRRRVAGARRGRLLPGAGLRPASPARVHAGRRRGGAARDERGRPREAEVLRLLAPGMTTRQIAAELVISPKTADHHIQHVYTKVGVSTRGAAALFAIEQGLLASDTGVHELHEGHGDGLVLRGVSALHVVAGRDLG